jgi:hypothetical protein
VGIGSRPAVHRLNAVCPYFTMFPLDFPLSVLDEFPATRVLDPFCGRGTTLYASRLRGISATGIDTNPVAVALSAAKTHSSTPARVTRLARELITGNLDAPAPEGVFWDWCYNAKTLTELSQLRQGLQNRSGADAAVLRAIVLGVLHGPRTKGPPSYLSNQMPRTFASKPEYSVRYWSGRGMKPMYVDVVDVISRRAKHVLADVPPAMRGHVHHGEASTVLRRLRKRFDLVITSPPYFGMRTYLPDQWLRWWFLGGPAHVDYSAPTPLASADRVRFIDGLAEVWAAAATRCVPGARLVVRFGALPSMWMDPSEIVQESLIKADAGWSICRVRSAGASAAGRRQAEQFGKAGRHVDEVDLVATLQTCVQDQ